MELIMEQSAKYLQESYLFSFQAKVSSITSLGESYLLFCDQTIFYPQGGGQPCDLGTLLINDVVYPVTFVKQTEQGIAHYIDPLAEINDAVGMTCQQQIDQQRRLMNAKLHTAGHLISHIMETIDHDLLPIKGHHFLNEAFIEMLITQPKQQDYAIDHINQRINQIVAAQATIEVLAMDWQQVNILRPYLSERIPANDIIRMIAINGFTPVPCGGTHLANTRELAGVKVTKIKRKKDRLKVSYAVEGI